MSTKKRMPAALLFERILSVMTIAGLTCLSIGLPLYMIGKASNDALVDRVGAYVLLIGVTLIAVRIFYWIAEEMVGRGLESMAKQEPT